MRKQLMGVFVALGLVATACGGDDGAEGAKGTAT